MRFVKNIVVLLMLISLSSCAQARSGMIGPDGQSPVVKVVRDVREAVVQVSIETVVNTRQNSHPFFDDPFFRQFFRVPQQPQQQSQPRIIPIGSGFIFEYNESTNEAFIMTNNHVAEQSRNGTLKVALADKKTYDATVVGLDANTDVAVIKIKLEAGEKVTVAPLGDSSKLEIGEWAIAIGNPFGDSMERTVTLGVVSALGRYDIMRGNNELLYQDFIQTDAAINPGNSGGPLLNINGQVIGINTAIVSSSGGNIGIGFAIPINLAKRVVDDLIASGRVQRAYMGILPQEITADLVEAFNLKEISGVMVAKVEDDSPAAKGGLKVGDVIMEIAGEKVNNVARFRVVVATAKIGAKVPVKIVRDDKQITLNVTLETFPEDSLASAKQDQVKIAASTGITVENTDGAVAKRLNITSDKGVVVSAVESNSAAFRSGLQVGMVILQVEGKEVNNVGEFNTEIAAAKTKMEQDGRRTIRLYLIDRNQSPRFMVLRFDPEK